MRSPALMHNIQIDITNACINRCSNCTRFCGHHKKPYFMEYPFFCAAVDSLKDFDGVVGMMGGEPTLHPEFEKFSRYLAQSRLTEPEVLCRMPIHDMSHVMHSDLIKHTKKACGLWSTLGSGYYKHFETISDVFGYQILNDHKNPCKHQGLLISWKDCGITEQEWHAKREKCWIQNCWSASITPKGAFFCEVAAALDMLFDGPGGWDISDHAWWRKTPEEFGDQLQWCEICGAALDTPARYSYDGRDDISQTVLSLLEVKGSPKVGNNQYVLFDGNNTGKAFESGDEYIRDFADQRIKKGQATLYPKNIYIASIDDTIDTLRKKGVDDWVWVPLYGKGNIPGVIKGLVFNPGCYYQYKEKWVFFNMRARALSEADGKLSLTQLKELYAPDKFVVIKFRDLYPLNFCMEYLRSIVK